MVSSLHRTSVELDEPQDLTVGVPDGITTAPEAVHATVPATVHSGAVVVSTGGTPKPAKSPKPVRSRPDRPPVPMTRARLVTRSIGIGASVLAGLLIGLIVYLTAMAGVAEARTQQNLFKTFRSQLAQGIAPVGPTTAGAPVAIVTVPRLDLRAVVVEGTASGQLLNGPGHRSDTPLPGQPGTSVIFGKRSIAGAPFSHLADLRAGDVIQFVTGQAGGITFVVTGIRDSRDAFTATPSTTPTLSLVTGSPPWRPTHSIIVSAKLTSAPQEAAGARPAITPAERSLAGDGGGLLPAVLWGQVLVLLVAAMTWTYLHWSRWPTYVLSTPILLAVLWNIYENIARLLPNLL